MQPPNHDAVLMRAEPHCSTRVGSASWVQDFGFGDSEFRIRDAEFGIRDWGFGLRVSEFDAVLMRAEAHCRPRGFRV